MGLTVEGLDGSFNVVDPVGVDVPLPVEFAAAFTNPLKILRLPGMMNSTVRNARLNGYRQCTLRFFRIAMYFYFIFTFL